jgi:hypothetical protein
MGRMGFGLNSTSKWGTASTRSVPAVATHTGGGSEVSEVIVIGGGMAGICAALELLDAGKSCSSTATRRENFGGLAKESFGGIFVVGTPRAAPRGIRDTPAQALADWRAFGELDPADHWPRPGPRPTPSAATTRSGSGCARGHRLLAGAALGRARPVHTPAIRCRASTSSGAPAANWRCA